jgi:tetratricopeptide (TPR) repeat protein
MDPASVDALNNKGIALSNLDKDQEAIGFYDRLLEINPEDVDALHNKAWSFYRIGNYTYRSIAAAVSKYLLLLYWCCRRKSQQQNLVISQLSCRLVRVYMTIRT